MRKEMDLRVEEEIEASVRLDDEEVAGLLERMKDYIAGEVRARRLQVGSLVKVEGSLVKDWSIEDLEMTIGVLRG